MNASTADVVVVGGGTAGIAAAVSAARMGASTVLVERRGSLGGMASSALVHTLCGLYRLRDDESDAVEFSNGGFPKEFAERLVSTGGARGPVRMGKLDVLLHRPAALAYLADQIIAETPNLTVMLHSELAGIEVTGRHVTTLQIHCRGTRMEIAARAVIDTSGDAEAAALAGADFEHAPAARLQRPAYIFGMGGIASGALAGEARLRLAHAISSAVSSGVLERDALGVSFREGMTSNEAWATLDLQADPFDPCSPECLSRIEAMGRRMAFSIVGFLRENAAGFQQAFISTTPAQAGIRESRRVCGRATLSAEDILAGRACDNAVAFASWPLELRENATGPRFRFPDGNRSAGIPLGCLQSRSIENLFVAGRCISCTHEAQASIRVTGTCMATGEAAGVAAAHYKKPSESTP
jgi:hypothetical protein